MLIASCELPLSVAAPLALALPKSLLRLVPVTLNAQKFHHWSVLRSKSCKQEPNVETYIFERKMDNAKPCGGAIPICMVDEFQIPADIIDRKVRKMLMISPTGKEVPIGSTLKPEEYIGMTR